MRVSLSWLGVFIILIATIYFSWRGFVIYESFQESEKPKNTEGFKEEPSTSDIVVTTCPMNAESYVNTAGQTICCDGDVVSGQCKGTNICTLSEGNKLPTCSLYWASLLAQRGLDKCPGNMPNYFEGAVKGCTSGSRLPDGSGPATTTQKFCKLYATEDEELRNSDSCTNIKMLEDTQCFSSSVDPNEYNVTKSLVQGDGSAVVYCGFRNKGIYGGCYTNFSFYRFMDFVVNKFGYSKGWRENLDPGIKIQLCSIQEQYSINKTLEFKDIPTASLV